MTTTVTRVVGGYYEGFNAYAQSEDDPWGSKRSTYVLETLNHALSDGATSIKANILIDRTGHACLADFGLLTIASDATNVTSSNSFREGGTCRWMGPELFNPNDFGLKDSRPTKPSDCYALGMVVYEVLSGKVPFHRYGEYYVVLKVSEGVRPERPPGAKGPWFGDGVWDLLQHCWKHSPGDRPSIHDVLSRLEEVSRSWTPPQMVAGPPTETSLTWDLESSTGDSSDEGEVCSSPQKASPQSSHEPGVEGNPTKNAI